MLQDDVQSNGQGRVPSCTFGQRWLNLLVYSHHNFCLCWLLAEQGLDLDEHASQVFYGVSARWDQVVRFLTAAWFFLEQVYLAFEVLEMDLHLSGDFLSLWELDLDGLVFLRKELVLAVESVVGESELIVLLLKIDLGLS